MPRVWNYVPRVAIFLAGVAAGAITRRREESQETSALSDLKQSLITFEKRLDQHESNTTKRFEELESRVGECVAKIAETPSTAQIVSAMEQLLSKTMASLDERLTAQAHAIETLKSTVSQTDSLLERVLESLDSLHSYADTPEAESLLEKPVV
jgi:uncharacterized coiled-coil protein SlyX